jgi:DNA-directed RNA polymerase specialized sigma24 family protein
LCNSPVVRSRYPLFIECHRFLDEQVEKATNMAGNIPKDPPPKSTDVGGWRQIVDEGWCCQFPFESIVAALQDLGPNTDRAVRNGLAKYLSDSIYTILRRNVGRNHPNEGQDIIDRVHFQFFEALAKPTSADGKAMREYCVARVLFRLKDAISKEARDRRVPDETKVSKRKKQNKAEKLQDEALVEVNTVHIGEPTDVTDDEDASDGEERGLPRIKHDPSLMDGVRDLDQQIDVDRFLKETIKDDRKRLAFRLVMDDVPYKSKKSNSIAKALGIDETTARKWIREVQEQLKEKVGDKS